MNDSNNSCIPLESIELKHQGSIPNLVALILIFFFGVFGNGSILLLFIIESKLRDVNNAFIANLAFSDFLLLICFVPSLIFQNFYFFRPFGVGFCRFLTPLTYCSHDVSILSLVVLSYIRYRAVMHPMEHYTKHRKAWSIMVGIAIWVISVAFAVFPSTICDSVVICDFMTVHIVLPNDRLTTYQFIRFIVLYVIPLFIILLLYSSMAAKLFAGGKMLKRNNSTSARKAIQSRQRLGIIVLSLISIFALSWLPRYILVLHMFATDSQISPMFMRLANALILLGSALNPVVLYSASTMFRKHLMVNFLCCRSRNRFVQPSRATTFSWKRSSRNGRSTENSKQKPSCADTPMWEMNNS